jgi:hypothetical protein
VRLVKPWMGGCPKRLERCGELCECIHEISCEVPLGGAVVVALVRSVCFAGLGFCGGRLVVEEENWQNRKEGGLTNTHEMKRLSRHSRSDVEALDVTTRRFSAAMHRGDGVRRRFTAAYGEVAGHRGEEAAHVAERAAACRGPLQHPREHAAPLRVERVL